MSDRIIKVSPDVNELAIAAAEIIVSSAEQAIAERGVFSIALSGGSTPKVLFELLAAPAYVKRIDFTNWEIYFGDERCVPPVHKDSNFRMASEALLDHVPIKPEHIHRMKGELDPQVAAGEYDALLQKKFPVDGMDLILLGMGDDGHTASLFPGTGALDVKDKLAVANRVEKLNTWRITLTAPFINRAREIMVLVAGAGKKQRVAEVLEGPRDPHRLPIQMIEPVRGKLLWLMDVAAAGMDELD